MSGGKEGRGSGWRERGREGGEGVKGGREGGRKVISSCYF